MSGATDPLFDSQHHQADKRAFGGNVGFGPAVASPFR